MTRIATGELKVLSHEEESAQLIGLTAMMYLLIPRVVFNVCLDFCICKTAVSLLSTLGYRTHSAFVVLREIHFLP